MECQLHTRWRTELEVGLMSFRVFVTLFAFLMAPLSWADDTCSQIDYSQHSSYRFSNETIRWVESERGEAQSIQICDSYDKACECLEDMESIKTLFKEFSSGTYSQFSNVDKENIGTIENRLEKEIVETQKLLRLIGGLEQYTNDILDRIKDARSESFDRYKYTAYAQAWVIGSSYALFRLIKAFKPIVRIGKRKMDLNSSRSKGMLLVGYASMLLSTFGREMYRNEIEIYELGILRDQLVNIKTMYQIKLDLKVKLSQLQPH